MGIPENYFQYDFLYRARLLVYHPCFNSKLTFESGDQIIKYSFLESIQIEFPDFELDMPECGTIKYLASFVSISAEEEKVYKKLDRDNDTKSVLLHLDNEIKDHIVSEFGSIKAANLSEQLFLKFTGSLTHHHSMYPHQSFFLKLDLSPCNVHNISRDAKSQNPLVVYNIDEGK